MTNNVFSGTLNHTQSINQLVISMRCCNRPLDRRLNIHCGAEKPRPIGNGESKQCQVVYRYISGVVRRRFYYKLEALGSAYLRQGTSYQCLRLANEYEQQIYVC